MKFAGEIPLLDLNNKLILTPDLKNAGQILLYQPLYIPVIRYTTNEGSSIGKTDIFIEDIHCGNYYYYEPYSDVYLLSNRTMFVPGPDLAYLYLHGGDELALNRIINEKYPNGLDQFSTIKINNIQKSFNTWLNGESAKLSNGLGIQQELCFLAKSMGIDTIVIMYSLNINNINTYIKDDEIIDVRDRGESYESLFREL